jgi:hypothetical protein
MHGDVAAPAAAQDEDVVDAAVDSLDPLVRAARRVGTRRQRHRIGQLVADQRLRAIEEVRQYGEEPTA